MAKLIDKDALLDWAKETYLCENASAIRKVCYKQLIEHLDTLEVKEVDLKDCDAMNGKIDDSDISCNCTSCPVHTTCKYFNPEKESNVKHCFGGVPMQLKQRKESAVKEVDLEG